MTPFASLAALRSAAATFAADEHGSTAIEYGLIAAGIGAFVAGAIWNLGSNVKTTFYDKLQSLF